MMVFFCNCRCGCAEEVRSPFWICAKCNKGVHQHLNLDFSIRRTCDRCDYGDQVFDRSACQFVCDPSCSDFGKEKTHF